MRVTRVASALLVAAAVGMSALSAPPAMGQTENTAGQAWLVVTVKSNKSHPPQTIPQSDIRVKLNGHPTDVVGLTPLKGPNGLQLVFLIDEALRSDWVLQIPDLKKFIEALPPSTAVAIAYMDNGRAVMAQTLTTDHALAAKSLRVTNGMPDISGSPYFCLSDLAKNFWHAPAKTRRVVFMVTNGQDPYYRSRDMQDPYVAAAIQDAQKAKLLVYSIYFRNRFSSGPNSFSTVIGQSYLQRVADQTGGQFYSMAMSSPVSFAPFLKQFKHSLERQYLLTFAVGNTGWQRVQVQSKAPAVKLSAPKAIYVDKNP